MQVKKLTAIALATIMVATVGAGCKAQQNAAANSSSKKITIVVSNWAKTTDSGYATYQKNKQLMESKYPNITIQPDEWTYDVNSFLPKAASGQLPTIYVTWFTETNKIIDANYAKDISAAAKKYNYSQSINSSVLKLMTKSNKLYGLPQGAYSTGLVCNVNLFKKAGLVDANGVPKFPKTYDELIQDAQAIKQKTGQAGFGIPTKQNCGGWLFMPLAWSYGTAFETKTDGKWKATFNSSECASALQVLKDLKWKYDAVPANVMLSRDDIDNLLGTDQLGMCIGTVDDVKAAIKNAKASKDNYAMCQSPAGAKGQYALMGGSVYMIAPNATSDQVDAAMKWLQVQGFKPTMDEDAKTAADAFTKADSEAGYPVGPHYLQIWTNKERVSTNNEIIDKYKNVNMSLWNDYDQNCDKNLKAEEPMNCQEIYKAFDTIIQNVLTDKNANCQQLLDTAAKNFQSDYLDNAQS